MLEIKNITICYKDRPTVKNFSMTLKRGEIASLVGESGSGKTTVIRAVLGLLAGGGRVTKGDILFEGTSQLSNTPDQWRALRGTDISMIFRDSGAMLNPIRKIGDGFVEYIRTHEALSKKDAWEKGVRMLERMRLPSGDNIMNSYPFQLSGGMRQRVGIAMAMTFQPKLLLADEPTSALDVTTQAQIVRQMMELREEYGTSILERKTIKRESGEITEYRYFISSLSPDIALASRAVRGHWAIESMHWHLDVTFKEDANTTLDKLSAQNLNIIRKWSLSILKLLEINGRKMSLRRKRFNISLGPMKFLEDILRL